MRRSTLKIGVSVSDARLLPEVGSKAPTGAVTDAVLSRLPVAAGEMAATAVYVNVPPTGMLTVTLILPVPLTVGQVAPPAAAQDQATPVIWVAENVSATVAPVAFAGPALVTTIVYVVDVPGAYVGEPSVFVMPKFMLKIGVSVSVAVLLAGAGSETVAGVFTEAVLTRLPVAAGLTFALTVNVTEAPTGRLMAVLMLPLPLAGHEPPAAPVHVHVIPERLAGNVSITVAPVTAFGPLALRTTIVYVSVPPTIYEVEPSVIVMLKSAEVVVGRDVADGVTVLVGGLLTLVLVG